jgi:hypothetical protein
MRWSDFSCYWQRVLYRTGQDALRVLPFVHTGSRLIGTAVVWLFATFAVLFLFEARGQEVITGNLIWWACLGSAWIIAFILLFLVRLPMTPALLHSEAETEIKRLSDLRPHNRSEILAAVVNFRAEAHQLRRKMLSFEYEFHAVAEARSNWHRRVREYLTETAADLLVEFQKRNPERHRELTEIYMNTYLLTDEVTRLSPSTINDRSKTVLQLADLDTSLEKLERILASLR